MELDSHFIHKSNHYTTYMLYNIYRLTAFIERVYILTEKEKNLLRGKNREI